MPKAPRKHRPAHALTDKERHQAYNLTRRNDMVKRWRSSARWQKVRLLALKRDGYLCQECLRNNIVNPKANDADHIKMAHGNENLFFDLDNIQALCRSCHNAKTWEERRGHG